MATAYTGTVSVKGKAGGNGEQRQAQGYYDLTGAIIINDTITLSGIIPQGGAWVRDVELIAPELDTSASPAGTVIVGNSDDDDGFIKARGVAATLDNSLAEDILIKSSDGALINTFVTNPDIVIKFPAAPATSATTGTIYLKVLLEGGAA